MSTAPPEMTEADRFRSVFQDEFEANISNGMSRQQAAVSALSIANYRVHGVRPAGTEGAGRAAAEPQQSSEGSASAPSSSLKNQDGASDTGDEAVGVTGSDQCEEGEAMETEEAKVDECEATKDAHPAPSLPASSSSSGSSSSSSAAPPSQEEPLSLMPPTPPLEEKQRALLWTARGLVDAENGRLLSRSEWGNHPQTCPDEAPEPMSAAQLLECLRSADRYDTASRDAVHGIFCKQISVQANFTPMAEKIAVSTTGNVAAIAKALPPVVYEKGWDLAACVDAEAVVATYNAVYDGFGQNEGAAVLQDSMEILAESISFDAGSVSSALELKPLVVALENPFMSDPVYDIALKYLLIATDKLCTAARVALRTWIGNMDKERYMRGLGYLRQYSVIRMIMGVVEDARPAVRLLDLFHHNMERFDGLSLEEDFYNEAIKEYMSEFQGKRQEYRLWREDIQNIRIRNEAAAAAAETKRETEAAEEEHNKQQKKKHDEVSGGGDSDEGAEVSEEERAVTLSGEAGASEASSASKSLSSTWGTSKIPLNDNAYKCKSFISFPFVLTTAMKQEILLIDSRAKQDHLQRRIFFGQGGRATAYDVYLILHIRRDAILEDTLNQLVGVESDDFKKPLKIKFDGEEGIDAGGVRKEYFALMMKMLLSADYGMFTNVGDVRLLWFNKDSFESNQEFNLVGKLVGLALYNTVTLDLKLPQFVYRQLKGGNVSLKDLKELHPDLAMGLQQLLDFEPASQIKDAFGLTFEISQLNAFGDMVSHELVPGGSMIEVDGENRQEYVDVYVKWLLQSSVETQFQAFKDGFLYVCGGEALDLFYSSELELLLCGNPVLNFDDLKAGTEYEDGFKADDRVIEDFWKVLTDFNEEQKKAFLKFVSGNDRAPIDGLSTMGFKISKNGDDDARLPTAHTCFNHLLLPEYSNIDILRRKLQTAIDNSEGFGLQ